MAPQDQDKKCNYRSSGNNMKERGVASRAQITKYCDFLLFDNRTATKFSQRHVEGFEAKTAKDFGAVKGALNFHYFQVSMAVRFLLEMLCLPAFCCQGACRTVVLSHPAVGKRASSLKDGSNRTYLVTTAQSLKSWSLFSVADLLRFKWACAERTLIYTS